MNLHMTRRKALALLAIGIAFLCSSWGVGENDRPNILVIIADDCTHNDLALYGGQNAKTPRIDTFARESLVFNKAYVSEAMCQPCRSEMYSGQHPIRNGAAWNHSGSRLDTKTLPHFMGDLGYRVALSGKTHIKPKETFPFEYSGKGNNPEESLRLAKELISKDMADTQSWTNLGNAYMSYFFASSLDREDLFRALKAYHR